MITVKISGGIKKGDAESETVTLKWESVSVLQLMRHLTLDEKQVGAVLVNGLPKKMTYTLKDGDEVQVLPVLSGG